jgi:outer membrane biosynthesis protein TonB
MPLANLRRLALPLLLIVCVLVPVLAWASGAAHRRGVKQAQVSRGKCVAAAHHRAARRAIVRCPRPVQPPQGADVTAAGDGSEVAAAIPVAPDPSAPAVGPAVEPSGARSPEPKAPGPEAPAPETQPSEPSGPEAPAPETPEPEQPAPEQPEPETPVSEPPTTEPPPSEPPTTEPPPSEPPTEVEAQAENFAGQSASVLLPAAAGVTTASSSGCVGLTSSGHAFDFGGVDAGPAGAVRLELVPEGTMPAAVRCSVGDDERSFDVAPAAAAPGGVVRDPIDPGYLTGSPFGTRSFWIQPWRAYLDTWPASRLLGALGINFNVTPAEAEGTARLLQSSGFQLGRIELSWNLLSYEDPDRFADPAGVRQRLVAMREHGLRPLILLNANSGGPGPALNLSLTTTDAAAAGARTVTLDPASAAAVVPGKTGFDDLSFGGSPDVMVVSVDAGNVATLSRPLSAALPAGPHPAATLRYTPFGPPQLADGSPNPAFEETLGGWLRYVAAVRTEADAVFGPGGYDFEIWNELSFGSEFLSEESYYSPPRVNGSGSVTQTLLERTVAYLRDPANGISDQVGISDGFAGQTPFVGGGSVPVGTTALSKHPYRGPQYFPRNAVINSIRPLDARGASDSTTGKAPYTPRFTPSFASALPEYYLTATQTETMVRDLAPFTTQIYGVPHGREIGPAGAAPVQTWVTEYNLNTNTLFPLGAENPDQYIGTASAAEKERLQAVIALRSLVSMTAKGVARTYFYAAAHAAGYSLIGDRFMAALDNTPGVYPGDSAGGATMDALRHLLARFSGPGPDGPARQLELRRIAQQGNHAEFTGDGGAAHPDLYDRELLAVFPFQASPTRFVVPVYVMTPNLTTVYSDGEDRFDLPDERFRITLGNLPATVDPPAVSAYDPIRDLETPARLVSRQGDRAVFEVAATNYPRLLTIEYDD